ncbi:MAG: TRAP transporter large permease subunit [Neisseriaceae bacterium]|nr:TRAP transporter large permease subunit [Neisseriaceae bacterium]
MNAVLLAVLVMLVLSVARVHVVLSLLIGALVGGLAGGLGVVKTVQVFQEGLAGGATIALSYAMLGAFAMAIAHSGLPQSIANWVIAKIEQAGSGGMIKWTLLLALVGISISSQNILPIHIAFIPLIVPPLLVAMTKLKLDRRAVACCLTFGLVTTYMFLPYGFGDIFLNKILLANIQKSGLDVSDINVMHAMLIPALGMVAGLFIAVFVSYRRPREYALLNADAGAGPSPSASPWRTAVALAAVVLAFVIQLQTGSMIVGALVGFVLFMVSGVVRWKDADDVFNQGLRMMALVGFIMISAQGFAEVMKATDQIKPMVDASAALFAGSKGMAALAMLVVGLIITMGIGSSFSTIPIIAAIYTPLCLSMGFSPLATVALIGAAGALGDAGSPASDSTLGPTAGLNVDGQHDHMRDTVIPTFLHFNIPVMITGWIAAMVL